MFPGRVSPTFAYPQSIEPMAFLNALLTMIALIFLLRRVLVAREDGRPALVIATNDLVSPANVIAANYKARWGIELFFKWLKQNLSVRTFLGRSENAVRIQIFVALITYLLLQIQHAGSAAVSSLRCCLTELRAGLFQRKETDHQLLQRRQRRQLIWTRMQGALPL